jgi:4-diphosphocytidyl-2-C-methyl-D-erythritol kinase
LKIFSEAIENALKGGHTQRELARAKINLALHVTGRRPDGYHNIETLAVFADYGDMLSSTLSDNGAMALGIDGPFGKLLNDEAMPGENLVVRAVEALNSRAGEAGPLMRLLLTKRIPVAAGLGGGSADAAATLRLLNRDWELGLDDKLLAEIGAPLGADIPMCVHSQPVVATGIGEAVKLAAAIPPLPVVLAFPGGGLLTEAVYSGLKNIDGSGLPALPTSFASQMDFVFWLRQTRNDLEPPAMEISALAGAAAKALGSDADCLFARMSGSGSSGFGIFYKLQSAERAAARISAAHPDWWVQATMTGGS